MSGHWLFPTTRWSIYLRDGCACIYCSVTLQQCIEKGGPNFLSVDHVVAKSKKPDHRVTNLITCCYECNVEKRADSVTQFCRDRGLNPGNVGARSRRRRRRDIEQFRLGAKILLGLTPWATIHQTVSDHDWLVRRQFRDSIEQGLWEHLQGQSEFWCDACNRPLDDATAIPF